MAGRIRVTQSRITADTWGAIERYSGELKTATKTQKEEDETGGAHETAEAARRRHHALEEVLNHISAMQRYLEQDFFARAEKKGVLPLHMRKQEQEHTKTMIFMILIALTNTIGDIMFMLTSLKGEEHELYIAAVTALSLCLLVRLGGLIFQSWTTTVKKGMWCWAAWYSALALVEPTEGCRMLKKVLDEHDQAMQRWAWVPGKGHVRVNMDAVASFAKLDLKSTKTEIWSIGISTVVQDVPGIAIQVLYALADPQGLSADFYFTAGGTVLHCLLTLWELRTSWSMMSDLKQDQQRVQTFEKYAEDDTEKKVNLADDTDVKKYAENCKDGARQMVMRGCHKLSGESLHVIAEKCQFLELLDLSFCRNVQDRGGWLALIDNCPHLTSIALQGCTAVDDEWILPLADKCEMLKSVNLKKCKKITSASIEALSAGLAELNTLVVGYCPLLEDKAFSDVKNLESLAIDGCPRLTDAAIRRLLKACGRKLESVYLDNLTAITADTVEQMAHACPHLQVVGLKACTNITDATVRTLASNCDQLAVLGVSECNKLTDASVTTMRDEMMNLQVIYAESPTKITDECIDEMLRNRNGRQKRSSPTSAKNIRKCIGPDRVGGYMTLGYKCDDYIQDSVIDPEAGASVQAERKWITGEINAEVRRLIDLFGNEELPHPEHKVSFKAKDKANADDADVLIGFRVDVPSTGAGTEQTLNYGLFGNYCFVEQFKNGQLAGGALQRHGLITDPAADWTDDERRHVMRTDATRLEFMRGEKYAVWPPFVHETPKDEKKSAAKGKDVHKMQPVTAVQLQQRRGSQMQEARRSAISFTLAHASTPTEARKADSKVAKHLTQFIRGVEARKLEESKSSRRGGGCDTQLRLMVSGVTEAKCPGVQDRVESIFKRTFSELLAFDTTLTSLGKISNAAAVQTKDDASRPPQKGFIAPAGQRRQRRLRAAASIAVAVAVIIGVVVAVAMPSDKAAGGGGSVGASAQAASDAVAQRGGDVLSLKFTSGLGGVNVTQFSEPAAQSAYCPFGSAPEAAEKTTGEEWFEPSPDKVCPMGGVTFDNGNSWSVGNVCKVPEEKGDDDDDD
eukprot:g1036.t1